MELDLAVSITPELSVAVLTGAGISAESGVPTFRGKGSMWENPEAVALARKSGSPWNTKGTWEFYEWRRQLVKQCDPNPAHHALVEMEDYFEDFTLITQNVDGLHRSAGNRNVLELHGNMWMGRCTACDVIVSLPDTPLPHLPPMHDCGKPLRIHVVQFGEGLDPDVLNRAFAASARARLFIVIGTSGVVHPAADLPILARKSGAEVIEINYEPTVLTPFMSISFHGNASELVPRVWEKMKSHFFPGKMIRKS